MLTVTKSVSVVACLILGSFICIIDQVVTSSATYEPGKPLTLLYYFDFVHWAQYNMPYHCNGHGSNHPEANTYLSQPSFSLWRRPNRHECRCFATRVILYFYDKQSISRGRWICFGLDQTLIVNERENWLAHSYFFLQYYCITRFF